jgi:hypothetical protein
MTLLISKVQFKRSEKGEFHDIVQRSPDETISLILNYPWNTERNLAPVELSCPSVTIEHPVGTFLKIGPYFSSKFSLYYLDTNHSVYRKTANTLEDAIVWVKTYFEQNGKLDWSEKYGFTFRPASHFRTNTFEYTADRKAIFTFFRFPFIFSPFLVGLCLLGYLDRPESFNVLAPVTLLFLLLLIGSPLVYLFFNYLSVDKDSYLQISKGHDEFLYGPIDQKKSYSKLDITEINAYGVRNSRSPWSECEVFLISFNNGEQIQFTSLLIDGNTLRNKFPDHQIINHKKFFPAVRSRVDRESGV